MGDYFLKNKSNRMGENLFFFSVAFYVGDILNDLCFDWFSDVLSEKTFMEFDLNSEH